MAVETVARLEAVWLCTAGGDPGGSDSPGLGVRGGPRRFAQRTNSAGLSAPLSSIVEPVTTEQQFRDKLRKITALFEGAATAGERQAAAAAIERIRQALHAAAKTQPCPNEVFHGGSMAETSIFRALPEIWAGTVSL